MIEGKSKTAGMYGPWKDWCDWCLAALESYGITGTVTSGVRSTEKQRQLYNDYVSGKSSIIAAPPGRSAHEYGLAIDFVVDQGKNSDLQRQVMNWFQSMGGELVAGDPVHVQYPGYRQFLGS